MNALADNDTLLSVPEVPFIGITHNVGDILIKRLKSGTSFRNIRDIVIAGGIIYCIT